MSSDPVRRDPVRLLSAPDEHRGPSLDLAAYLYLPSGGARHPDQDQSGVSPASLPGLIVGHGAGSHAARHAEFCTAAASAGFAVLALDFRGHGSSGGRGDGPLEFDLLAAAAFLRSHPEVDPTSICYRGSSMGGFYGLRAAPAAGFAAMVLISPASEATMLRALDEDDASVAQRDTEAPGSDGGSGQAPADLEATKMTAEVRWDRPRLRAYFEHQSSLSLATRITCPVLLVHARGDSTVPLEHSLELAKRLRGDVTLYALQGGSHTSAQHDRLVHRYCLGWLKREMESRSISGPAP